MSSFGGGSQYILEYVIKVTNQGGTGGVNQVNTGLHQVDNSIKQVTMSQEKLIHAQNKVQQAGLGMSKALKGMAFGFLGITTAGAEAVGMLGMWQQTQAGVKEAQDEVNRALAESGKESKDYKDAVMELAKANRWASMTNRNLMLSMFDLVPFIVLSANGMLKARRAAQELRTAQAELKVVQDALGISNTKTAASNALVTTSTTAKTVANTRFTASQAAANVQTIASTGAFTNQTVALGTATGATNLQTAATGRLTKAVRVLQIAMKVLIPLVALEVGAQAYARNWGGFADKINQVGFEIGKAIPQLQGFLGLVKKVGESVVAIFTGDFESIGDIWKPVTEGGEEASQISEKAQKKLDEARQAMLDFRNEASSFMSELGAADKGERKDLLKQMGLGKDARSDLKDTLDLVEEMDETLLGFHNAVKTMEALNIMQKFGIDVPNQSWKDMAKGLSKQFKELGKIIPGDDMFDEFSKVMKKASKTKGPAVVNAIMEFTKKNPNFMPFLKEWNPGLAAALQTMIDSAAAEASTKIGGADGIMSAIMGTSSRTKTVNEKFGEMDIPGSGGGGIFNTIIEKLKEGVKGLPAQIKAIDWTAAGQALRDSFLSIVTTFKLDDPVYLGNILRSNVIDPIFVAVGDALRPAIEEFKKDPVGFTIGVINMGTEWIGKFVAGLFGKKSEEELFNDWENQLVIIFRNNKGLTALRTFIADPIGYILDVLRGNEGGGSTSGGFNEQEATIFPERGQAPLLERLRIGADVILEALGVKQFLDNLPTFEDIKKKVLETPGVKELLKVTKAIEDAIAGGVKGIIDWIMSFGQEAEASGDMSGAVNSRFNGAMSPGEAIHKRSLDINVPTIHMIPNGITLPPTLPPLAPNSTPPVITPSSLTLKPQSLIYDLSTASTSIPQESVRIHDAVVAVFEDMVKLINHQFAHMASVFSVVANSLGANAQSGADQAYDAIDSAMSDIEDSMRDLADHWSSICNSLIANAKSAAKGINKALDSIEDEEVVIHYRATGSTNLAKGGLMSFANGGIMSAAGGKLLTTYGPQLFQIGDNPGGRESIWAIPHDNPGPTVSKIEKMYKGSGNGGSNSSIYNQTINLNIKGSDIIDDTKITRKIRTTMGSNMDRFG